MGDSAGSFIAIASGTAPGLGIDRGEAIGTGGPAAGEDLDEVSEGDYWRQNYEIRPYGEASHPYERFGPGEKTGWECGGGVNSRDEGLESAGEPDRLDDEEEREREEE